MMLLITDSFLSFKNIYILLTTDNDAFAFSNLSLNPMVGGLGLPGNAVEAQQ